MTAFSSNTLGPSNTPGQRRIAFLVENGFEDTEFQIPYTALQQAGAIVDLLGSRMNDEYTGKQGQITVKPTATATEVRAEDFDAIFIPGGHAPDRIRTNDHAVRLVMNAIALEKLIGAVCHGPQVLIEADQLRGRQVTGYHGIRKDLQNAGATYIDEPVVAENRLITARRPGDMAMFTTVFLSYLGLMVEGEALPSTEDASYEWWRLAERWGSSSRSDIVNVLNTALMGERYTLAAFRQYLERINDPQAQTIFRGVMRLKEMHLERLENRLREFDETVSWQALGSDVFATLQSWLQVQDENSILRRTLGDIQTGVVDSAHFAGQLTDPLTTDLLMEIHTNLAQQEDLVGQLYRDRAGQAIQPPTPTTVAVG